MISSCSLTSLAFKTLFASFFVILLSSSAFASEIKLAWDAPTTNADGTPLTDLAGYKIYYGKASGVYEHSVDVGNVTTYKLKGLKGGETYYIAVVAYDTSNNESDYSNEVIGAIFTVETNPSGLQVVVDSVTYTAPQAFGWEEDSSHSLSVASPQAEAGGTRYVYTSWSDQENQEHTIAAPSLTTTYTPNFMTQYSLTTAVNPAGGGVVNPAGKGWYDSGQSVSLSATASSDYSFSGWSGDLTGSANPASLIMNGPKNVAAQFTAIPETIVGPNAPSGPASGTNGISYTYIASGAFSNLGHMLEYQFDWRGDGTGLSLWGAANQQKAWNVGGHYNVRVRARCVLHPYVISSWSPGSSVEIQDAFQIRCPDGGIQCVERTDGGNDSDNLVNGKPKVDVEYEFKVIVQDTLGIPHYVKLFMTQRNDPQDDDFYGYDMSCNGEYKAGATCTYRTKLGPAAIHKFHFKAQMSNGAMITYPNSGLITGPEIQLLKDYNLVGIPRDINNARLDGQQALGSSEVYRWETDAEYYTEVTILEPMMAGEGYLIDPVNTNLIELANYGDVQGPEYTYRLEAGWNLISNPFGGNVRLSDVSIQKGNQALVPWHESATNGWVVNALYYYNGKDWGDTYSHMTAEDGAVLVPWLGYWVNLKATDDKYYLVIRRP